MQWTLNTIRFLWVNKYIGYISWIHYFLARIGLFGSGILKLHLSNKANFANKGGGCYWKDIHSIGEADYIGRTHDKVVDLMTKPVDFKLRGDLHCKCIGRILYRFQKIVGWTKQIKQEQIGVCETDIYMVDVWITILVGSGTGRLGNLCIHFQNILIHISRFWNSFGDN